MKYRVLVEVELETHKWAKKKEDAYTFTEKWLKNTLESFRDTLNGFFNLHFKNPKLLRYKILEIEETEYREVDIEKI